MEPVALDHEVSPSLDAVNDEDRLAIVKEVLPNTLRWLYGVRISIYALAGIFAIGKIILSKTVSTFLLDLVTDNAASRHVLEGWVAALQSIFSGFLAASMALVIATFLVQARLLAHVRRETIADEPPLTGRKIGFILKTFEREAGSAVLTGLLTVGFSELLSPGITGTAVGFGLLAMLLTGALNTLFFHLLFLLREAPVRASEKQYRRTMDQVQMRLADGSMRLQEALISRFEADCRRTVAVNRRLGFSTRAVREARRRLKARLWAVERVIPRGHLVAFAAQAREDSQLLERWTEEVDWLVNASEEVRRNQSFAERLNNVLKPTFLAQATAKERQRYEKDGMS